MADETNAEPEKAGIPQGAFAKATDQIRIRTDRFRQIYANNMAVNFSSWDLGITFGEIAGEREGKTLIEETVRVLMTKEIAKVLGIILKNHIDAYEKQFGEIRLPVAPDSGTEPEANEGAQGEPEPSKP